MRNITDCIPVILFAYARPVHLQRTLECLQYNNVPLLYAFSDGPADSGKERDVVEVRHILRSIDWCETVLIERDDNLGLGRSIITGVTSVLREYNKVIVFEDDLICVPGTYQYLCAALRQYENDARVTSVTGWTHPNLKPANIGNVPYFDGVGESWTWGTWARAWEGMDTDARTLMEECKRNGIDVYRYGQDFPSMAEHEAERNIWAVRFIYLQILKGGLCLRPPGSLVEHIGFDDKATNTQDGSILANPPLKECFPIPSVWPEPRENPECAERWRTMNTRQCSVSSLSRMKKGIKERIGRFVRRFLWICRRLVCRAIE